MGDRTAIDWTDATWPVVSGCTKVSPGCQNCYAIRDSWRMGHNPAEALRRVYQGTVRKYDGQLSWSGIVRALPERLEWPLHWRRPRRIFVSNMSDLFHPLVSDRFRCAVFGIMAFTPHHTHQVLTKRANDALEWFTTLDRLAEQALDVFPDESLNWRRWHLLRAAAIQYTGRALPSIPADPQWPLTNVHIGVTVESDDYRSRIDKLMECPAALRYVSYEPALGPLDLGHLAWVKLKQRIHGVFPAYHHVQAGPGIYPAHVNPHGAVCARLEDGDLLGVMPCEMDWCRRLDWVICGGESGPQARPLHPDWARSIRDQCQAAGTAFWFKQRGEYVTADELPDPWLYNDGQAMVRVGKRFAGHLLDGQEHRAFPDGRGRG